MPASHRRTYRPRRLLASAVAVALSAAPLAACGGGSSGGPVTLSYYIFNEPSGSFDAAAQDCGAASGGRYKIAYKKLPKSADDQRQQLVRRLAARDPSLDILGLDVVWPAEFAEAGWIREWTGKDKAEATKGTLQTPLETATWHGRLYGAPLNTNAQLMWYRSDLVAHPPQTWDEMIKVAQDLAAKGEKAHYVEVTGAQYEGLTVWFNTMVHSAGGSMLTPDGMAVALGEPARKALAAMRTLATSRAADPSLSNTMEDQARLAMEGGSAAFELNWPFVWASMQSDKPSFYRAFRWAPYPSVEAGRPSQVTVGGTDLAVSSYSRHPDLAFEAALCMRNEKNQLRAAVKGGLPPTQEALYTSTDPEFQQAYPFARDLLATLKTASTRPQTPAYQTLSINVSYALSPPSSIDPNGTEQKLRDRLNASLESKGLIP
jgi:multiple sugar transport system substrate-binding protein